MDLMRILGPFWTTSFPWPNFSLYYKLLMPYLIMCELEKFPLILFTFILKVSLLINLDMLTVTPFLLYHLLINNISIIISSKRFKFNLSSLNVWLYYSYIVKKCRKGTQISRPYTYNDIRITTKQLRYVGFENDLMVN